jgi:hypothetical protein
MTKPSDSRALVVIKFKPTTDLGHEVLMQKQGFAT